MEILILSILATNKDFWFISVSNLSNNLNWYDSVQNSAQAFANEVWKYSHDLIETKLFLQKQLANSKVKEKLNWLKENYTTTKKTLFGQKTVVVNEQDEVYSAITKDLYPNIKTVISSSTNKFQISSTTEEFINQVNKAAMIIDEPNKQFQESLKNSESLQEKKQLFLSFQ